MKRYPQTHTYSHSTFPNSHKNIKIGYNIKPIEICIPDTSAGVPPDAPIVDEKKQIPMKKNAMRSNAQIAKWITLSTPKYANAGKKEKK